MQFTEKTRYEFGPDLQGPGHSLPLDPCFAFPYTEVLALVARVPSSLSAPPCSAGDRLLFAHPLSLLCLQAVVSVLTGRVPICLLSVSFTGIEAHEAVGAERKCPHAGAVRTQQLLPPPGLQTLGRERRQIPKGTHDFSLQSTRTDKSEPVELEVRAVTTFDWGRNWDGVSRVLTTFHCWIKMLVNMGMFTLR